jgi:hypothetical protein
VNSVDTAYDLRGDRYTSHRDSITASEINKHYTLQCALVLLLGFTQAFSVLSSLHSSYIPSHIFTFIDMKHSVSCLHSHLSFEPSRFGVVLVRGGCAYMYLLVLFSIYE